ncbi:MAG: hypothetical protein IJF92_00045 [Bacilli bacterium]|nr:hypothetical protein [Bacilli bacterium]MBQ3307620.1 hypothetical protein [Bacilli bacterium]MBQ3422990.1 hypothetical protein [Romboutsia sp.]
MKKLEMKLDQYSGRRKLYKNTDLKIEPGITILIGKNRNTVKLIVVVK